MAPKSGKWWYGRSMEQLSGPCFTGAGLRTIEPWSRVSATAGSVMVKGGSIMVQGGSVTIQAATILLQGAVVITGALTVGGPIVGVTATGTTTTTALANII